MDLVIQAHVHDYERTWPLAHGVPTAKSYKSPTAPVYIVNGAAGNREHNDRPPGREPWEPEPTNGSKPYASDVSFGLMTFFGGNLSWEQFYSSNATVFDKFILTK